MVTTKTNYHKRKPFSKEGRKGHIKGKRTKLNYLLIEITAQFCICNFQGMPGEMKAWYKQKNAAP